MKTRCSQQKRECEYYLRSKRLLVLSNVFRDKLINSRGRYLKQQQWEYNYTRFCVGQTLNTNGFSTTHILL